MVDLELMKEAILIRRVEESFLELFSQGKLNGTVHTCIGQEFSAVAFAGQVRKEDSIFSNHRCHGHFISFTKDHEGLIAEIMGKEIGICGGVGSSQHLCRNNFFSNGIQGGIVPVAAGLALAGKMKGTGAICLLFIGDGTLGEGVVYETLNIVSKWELPLLIVCENNRYAQSTEQALNLAGSIPDRARAFGIEVRESSTWDMDGLIADAGESIRRVRATSRPLFHLVETYRLAPHSKGDDTRHPDEIEEYRRRDPINRFKDENNSLYDEIVAGIDGRLKKFIDSILFADELSLENYHESAEPAKLVSWSDVEFSDMRQVDLLNRFFASLLERDRSALLLGEDILAPYGGAFKVMKELSTRYPDQVRTTPISEQAITGISNGLALGGMKPYLEIMFGDFITLCLDQIINHASKFHHMYNRQVFCPIVIRTPMGGGRGYGPTHSQTLDKFLIGIDNVTVVALNLLIDPADIYEQVHAEEHPVIVIENKLDYGRKFSRPPLKNYRIEKSSQLFPLTRMRPLRSRPTATIVTYGAPVTMIVDTLSELILEYDILPELLVVSRIHPLDEETLRIITDSVEESGVLVVVEEGSAFAGFGSEVIATVHGRTAKSFVSRRIASLPLPIASSRTLESEILIGRNQIISTFRDLQQ